MTEAEKFARVKELLQAGMITVHNAKFLLNFYGLKDFNLTEFEKIVLNLDVNGQE